MKFKGFDYPIFTDAKGYWHNPGSDIDQIKSDMLILLLTNPGERVMLPDFGCDLRSLMFEPNDNSTVEKARSLITDALEKWEPRVAIQQIEISTTTPTSSLSPYDDRSQLPYILFIRINFVDPEDIQSVEELVLAVPLQRI